MSDASKSWMKCRECDTSKFVIRLLWTDYYPEGSRLYDDHVCLECGLYASQPSVGLGAKSLTSYKENYGHVLAPKKKSVMRVTKTRRKWWVLTLRTETGEPRVDKIVAVCKTKREANTLRIQNKKFINTFIDSVPEYMHSY